jgi:transposase
VLGRKRHILTDTLGLLLAVSVHPASIQDRDGAEALLREARRSFPFIERLIGDAGYQGPKMATVVARTGMWELQILRRCDQHRFVFLPRRWSNAPSHGSAVVVGSPAITSVTLGRRPCSSGSP